MNHKINTRWQHLRHALGKHPQSQARAAEEANVSQSTVSRILRTCPKRDGAGFGRLCKYAEKISAKDQVLNPAESKALMKALQDVWNGTDEHAEALAAIIRAAAEVGKHSR